MSEPAFIGDERRILKEYITILKEAEEAQDKDKVESIRESIRIKWEELKKYVNSGDKSKPTSQGKKDVMDYATPSEEDIEKFLELEEEIGDEIDEILDEE